MLITMVGHAMNAAMIGVLFLLAGCLGAGEEAPAATSSGASPSLSPTSSGSPGSDLEPAAPAMNSTVAANNCTKWSTNMAFPLTAGPGPAPASWEPEPQLFTQVWLAFFECQRVSVGLVERGPVRILMEGHNRISPPEKCTTTSPHWDVFFWLTGIWTNDTAVTSALSSFEMPAHDAQFDRSDTPVADFTKTKWSFRPVGGAPTELEFISNSGDSVVAGELERLFWETPPGVSVVTLEQTWRGPSTQVGTTTGVVGAPLILASTANGAFVGSAGKYTDWAFAGDVIRYGDLQCGP